MTKRSSQQIIDQMQLKPLADEGGYYRESYRSEGTFKTADYPFRRSFSTAIYYLITPESYSRLHRIPQDEIFHFYGGDAATMIQLSNDLQLSEITLGDNWSAGCQLQAVVPGGSWQGMRLNPGGEYALFGVTVAPAFEFSDLTIANDDLLKQLTEEKAAQLRHYI
jgi:predicted cupin superfamily sugar epimerase